MKLTNVWNKMIGAVANPQLLPHSTLYGAGTVTVVLVDVQVVLLTVPTTAQLDTDRSCLGIVLNVSDGDLSSAQKHQGHKSNVNTKAINQLFNNKSHL